MRKLLFIAAVIVIALLSMGLFHPRVFVGFGKYIIFEFDVNSTQIISGSFQTSSAAESIFVDWGDGTNNTYAGTSDQSYSKDYGSSGNRTVKIYASSGDVLTKFTMTQTGADISFDVGDMPSGMTYLRVYGSNTISGSISDMPSGMAYLYVYGSNTISGYISDMPSGMTFLYVTGSNTISGSISDIPSGMANLNVTGSNTISGSISDMPSGMAYIYVAGNNTISDYSSPFHATSIDTLIVIPASGGLSSSEVDQLLIDADSTVTSWYGGKIITLTGTNASRTSASDSAVTSLTGKGVTVTTN